jgi:integrase
MPTPKSKSGQLIWRRGGWSGRYYAKIDGERVRVCVPLETDNKAVARLKLDRLIAGEDAPRVLKQGESFEQAARRIVPTQGIKSHEQRMRRFEMYVFPRFGEVPVEKVSAGDVRDALDAAAKKGLSRFSILHILSDISGILQELYALDLLPENVARRCRVPKSAKVDKRRRIVLTDDEFTRFVESPQLEPELRLLALVSRCLGGMRTSDLHAWDWSHLDTKTWQNADVYRPKTDSMNRLALPEQIVPALQAWWVQCGRPSLGPVFPQRGGPNAGERRRKMSHAARLRRALWAVGVRRGESKEICELQRDTERARRVDFHSFRRAYNTGLARAGVNVQTAMALAGHTQTDTHMRYVALTEVLSAPESALPRARPVPILQMSATLSRRNNRGVPMLAAGNLSRQRPGAQIRARK